MSSVLDAPVQEERAIRAEQERERLMARLRELGVDPEGLKGGEGDK
jgi:hypothetical protein